MFENLRNSAPGGIAVDGHGASAPERRGDRRHVTVLRVAKVVRTHGDELCVIRNISSGGVMAHFYSPARVGEEVVIEFKSGRKLSGIVRWTRGEVAGVEFDEKLEIVRFLAGEDDVAGQFEPRAPRLGVGLPAMMRSGVRVYPVQVCDISQGGLKFRALPTTEQGQKLVFRVAGLPPLTGIVRWRDEEHAGVAFEMPLPLETLAKWAAETERSQ
ncbi:PilZ domain-containing protein [Sphingomonas cannabina]|uniref:PilZ domain-containing protein n=1 Tax=Sphingomonas cannabina TaxID=2899123 RepID=UPI001F2CB56A|nr:PilZ domain-containing protein [Sphingomonas cannabina]UIJ44981.1 PilZ domain-containing protein [Sphingomonas cannabina]